MPPSPLTPVSLGNGGYNFKTQYPTVRAVVNGKPFKAVFMVDGNSYLESSVLSILGTKYTGTEKIVVQGVTYIKWTALHINAKSVDGEFIYTKQ
ncbi:hypothetical protein D3C73_879850 [compost metagenome]